MAPVSPLASRSPFAKNSDPTTRIRVSGRVKQARLPRTLRKTVVIDGIVRQSVGMKSITVQELHEQTEQVVRRAAEEDGFIITSQGEPLAILKAARESRITGNPLPKRDVSTLPTTKFDSTDFISEERSGVES